MRSGRRGSTRKSPRGSISTREVFTAGALEPGGYAPRPPHPLRAAGPARRPPRSAGPGKASPSHGPRSQCTGGTLVRYEYYVCTFWDMSWFDTPVPRVPSSPVAVIHPCRSLTKRTANFLRKCRHNLDKTTQTKSGQSAAPKFGVRNQVFRGSCAHPIPW